MYEDVHRVSLSAIAFLVFGLFVAVCSPRVTADEKTVPTLEPDVAIRPGASFSWLGDMKHFYDAARFQGSQVESFVQDCIVEVLTSKGFQYVPLTSQSELLVGYMVVLGSKLSEAEIEALYEVEPELKSLGADPMSYEKGKLIIKVVDMKTQRLLWRGITQGFTAGLEMPDELHERRLCGAVADVLAQFPEGSK